APLSSCLARLAAPSTSSKRFGIFSRQSSTVTRAIANDLPVGEAVCQRARRGPSGLSFDGHPGPRPLCKRAVIEPDLVAELAEREIAERGARPAAAVRDHFLPASDSGRRNLPLELLARSEQAVARAVEFAPDQIDRVRDMARAAVEVALAVELLGR